MRKYVLLSSIAACACCAFACTDDSIQTIHEVSALDEPSSVECSIVSNNQVQIKWTDNSDFETGFTIVAKDSRDSDFNKYQVAANQTSRTIGDTFAQDEPYRFGVRANGDEDRYSASPIAWCSTPLIVNPKSEVEPPGTEQPGTEQPGTEQPGTEQPGTEQPGTEQPGTEQPGTEQPGTEQPGTEQPGTEQPGTEQPGTEQPDPTPSVKADLLDLAFYKDRTAQNLAPQPVVIKNVTGDNLVTYYNATYDRYVAHFNNPLGGTASAYYRVDYGANEAFKKALSDGHTLEAVFRLDAPHDGSKEAKFFASHESGGTGLMLSKSDKGQDITFLPHVGGNYVWTGSGIKPEVGRYYHVVGVWDKATNTAKIYVDGELKGTQKTSGDLKFASETWFGVGCDAGSTGNIAWNGDVAIARVYDKAVTADEVKSMYEQAKNAQPKQFVIRNVDARGTYDIGEGYTYAIYGTGLAQGDTIQFESTNSDATYAFATTVESDRASVVIPAEFKADDYRVVIVRDGAKYPITQGKVTLNPKATNLMSTKCVAHRGYHPSATTYAENSIAALKYAQRLGVYGSEFDVWISLDGELFINHDGKLNDVSIASSNAATVKKLKLTNGETIPTLRQYLEQGKRVPSVKMILEIKAHGAVTGYSKDENNARVINASAALVKEMGMEDQVEWIAFGYDNVKRIRKAMPNAIVQYLSGDKAPATMVADKISAIDYSADVLKDKLDWIKEAHNNGMFVNVWTVNTVDAIKTWISRGVDVVTTNSAKDMMNIIHVYVQKKGTDE